MTPIDPILPLSGQGDGIIIARTEHVHAVKRREQQDEQQEREGESRHRQHQEAAERRGIWVNTVDEAEAAGLYDDHGRGGSHDVEPAPHVHLDTSA